MKQTWLTPPRVAKALTDLGCTISTVTIRNWITKVVPESERVRTPGGHWRMAPEAVERFLNHFDSPSLSKEAKS